MTSHAIKPAACAHCESVHEFASPTMGTGVDRRPRAGDISLCVRCGKPSVWTEFLDLRQMTDEEWRALPRQVQGKLMAARIFVEGRARRFQAFVAGGIGAQAAVNRAIAAEQKKRACRVCGCTWENACMTVSGPCSWVEWDLCSACSPARPLSESEAQKTRRKKS